MADDAVVVGGGPGGLRAAAALASAGRRVTLLQEGPHVGGYAHPDIPLSRGVTPAVGALAEHLFGAMVPVEGLDRGVHIDGRTHRLPLGRAEIARLVPATQVASAAVAWTRTRGTIELRKIIGGGNEQRTYRDWVIQRFGVPVFDRFYAAYCQARFGPPEEISCNVARVFHGIVPEGPVYAPAAGPALPGARPVTGVEVRTNVVIRSVQGGQVDTEDGLFTGEVFLDIAPRRVVEWLGSAATPALVHDVGFLTARNALQVLVRCPQDLPVETHVLGGAPFYRIVRPAALPACGALEGTLGVHYALEAGDPLWSADDAVVASRTVEALADIGIEGASAAGARVQRIRDHHPNWTGTHLVRMRRYVIALEALELVPVGRAGLHAPLELSAETAYLEGVLLSERPTLRALLRHHVEPPVLDSVERAHLTRFVER
ncbi:MAG: NAD(P)-binding protein [Pseudomonadota bacterium]|nr:NAD(P)-binding protein [Pseudomonadota bacterium]